MCILVVDGSSSEWVKCIAVIIQVLVVGGVWVLVCVEGSTERTVHFVS